MSRSLRKIIAAAAIAVAAACTHLWTSVPRSVRAAAPSDGITGLPADVSPLLSIAGTWQPISSRYLDQATPSLGRGVIAATFAGNIVLPNQREGLVVTGWSYSGFDSTAKTITPVQFAVLEQQPDGTLALATSRYVADPETNGGANVLVADLNQDGVQDFFLPAHNERPFLPASSTAYLSSPDGRFIKTPVDDNVEAHGATLANIGGVPTVFTASYYVAAGPPTYANTATQYIGGRFVVTPDVGTGGTSGVAVADMYGDGTYSYVCSDCQYGPGFPFNPSGPNHRGTVLWNLSGLRVSGAPVVLGLPYFDGKSRFSSYPSNWDPIKTHSYRVLIDDFNYDGKSDILVQQSIWAASVGTSKSILQMFQNQDGYQFAEMTDTLNPEYDENCDEADYGPQIRDIDGSGIRSWLSGALGGNPDHPAANYVLANDGSGRFHVALHETLNEYGRQVLVWLASNPLIKSQSFYVNPDSTMRPAMRAYRTPNGRWNFVAIVPATRNVNPSLPLWITTYIFVNVPLQLDLASQFTRPIVIRNRNGSRLLRTFAGDDTIYAGNNGGRAKVDGGLGNNTVVYSGPARNYSGARNEDGSWTIHDNAGTDGVDTLFRIQRLQFSDATIDLTAALQERAPVISSVVNGATFQPGIVPGSWVTIQGRNLSGVTRSWSNDDFTPGGRLPTTLSGVQATFNGIPAAVWYISPTQLNVQAPEGLSGTVTVRVSYFGTSANFPVQVTDAAPGLFSYSAGTKLFPAAVYNGSSMLVGDPALSGAAVRKARPGEIVLLYATGIESSAAGVTLSAPVSVRAPVAVRIGSADAQVLGAALVYPGEFQINIVVPELTPGDYPLAVVVRGQSSLPGVTIPIDSAGR
jgi:uncharacterized protein (TIGR03437 family)